MQQIKPIRWPLLVSLLILLPAHAVSAAPALGTIHGKYVYSLAKRDDAPTEIRRQVLIDQIPMKNPDVFSLPGFVDPSNEYNRLWVDNDFIWLFTDNPSVRRIPHADLPFYFRGDSQGPKKYDQKYPKCPGFGNYHLWLMLYGYPSFPPPVAVDGPKPPPAPPPFVDYLPFGPTTGKIFLLELLGHISVWPMKATCDDEAQIWSTKSTRFDEDRIPLEFKPQQFSVFVRGTSYFFLPDSGTLFFAKKAERDKRKMVNRLGKFYKVLAVITDADKDRIYVFGKIEKLQDKKNHFFFELNEEAHLDSLKMFDPADLPKTEGPEPMRTALQYARFLAQVQKLP